MKNNEYPLCIESLDDCGGYYSKGHHDSKLFAETANKEYACNMKAEDVYHTYLRKRPCLPSEREYYGFNYFLCVSEKNKQGAFPATVYGF
jgi:hypothetical protein